MLFHLLHRFAIVLFAGGPVSSPAPDSAFVRVNQLGYLPDGPKVAVVCALRGFALGTPTK
ncbi:MAG TPA: cellulase N-terminal Ig-like domain-containing protein [Gemmatimonadaceae bacterium]|nr:cellulase N-terminal Ig-like domain-containing protein [Gemmatimonadaceae bacterium]